MPKGDTRAAAERFAESSDRVFLAGDGEDDAIRDSVAHPQAAGPLFVLLRFVFWVHVCVCVFVFLVLLVSWGIFLPRVPLTFSRA